MAICISFIRNTLPGTQWAIGDYLSGQQLRGSKALNLAIGPCSFSPRVQESKVGLKEDGQEWDARAEPWLQQRRSFLPCLSRNLTCRYRPGLWKVSRLLRRKSRAGKHNCSLRPAWPFLRLGSSSLSDTLSLASPTLD